jgi:hypothetical protein
VRYKLGILGNEWEGAVTFYYGYQRVERAICAAFEIPPSKRSKLRARIKHMQRLGLKAAERPPEARAEYEIDGIDMWVVALALMNSHVDPTIATRTVQANWRRPPGRDKPRRELAEIVSIARRAKSGGEHSIFLLLEMSALPGDHEPLVAVGFLRPVDLNKRGEVMNNWKLVFSDLAGSRTRVLVPLTYILHRLDKALAAPRGELP